MSVFSNQEGKGTDMRLPVINKQDKDGLRHMHTLQNSGVKGNGHTTVIQDLNSPATVTDSQNPDSPLRRSLSPNKTFFSYTGSVARGTMSNFNYK